MAFLKKTFIKASRIPAFNIGLLLFLAGLAVIKSVALTFMDISAVQLFLTQPNIKSMGIDFILIALLMMWSGYQIRQMNRHQGYGGFSIMTILAFFMTILIGCIEYRIAGSIDLLFIAKYVYFALVNTIFWTITARFMPLKNDSRKYTLLLMAEAFGYGMGGVIVYLIPIGAYGLLYYAMALLMMSYTGIYLLTQMVPVGKEKFLKPAGEAQNFTERKLVRALLAFSFVTLIAAALCNYAFYTRLATTYNGSGILKQMALWWSYYGGISFVLAMAFIIRLRYFYLKTGNMFLMSLAVGTIAFGQYHNAYQLVYYGFLGFTLIFHRYFNGYVSTLLKALTIRMGNKSVNRKRLTLIEPTAFMLGALFVVYAPQLKTQIYLLTAGALLMILTLLAVTHAYGGVILKALKLRIWPGTDLMIPNRKTTKYIKECLSTATGDDTIYFLQILKATHHPLFYKYVLKSLKNPVETVRLFALNCLGKAPDITRHKKALEFVFKTDVSAPVRARALALLIHVADYQEDTALLDSYTAFLDDRRMKTGAISGFLHIGGDYALLAMDGLQDLVHSSQINDRLAALQIMAQEASYGLIRLLMPLLKSPEKLIAGEALRVAGKMRHSEALPIILNSLDDVDLQENALSALRQFGPKAYPAIEKHIYRPEVSAFRKKMLILFLTLQSDDASRQVLLRLLKIRDQKLRQTIIRGMTDSKIFWVHKYKNKQLFESIRNDAERIFFLHQFTVKYHHAPIPEAQDAFAFLNRALSEEIAASRESVFCQLLLLNNMKIFQEAVRYLLAANYELYPVALGTVQDLVPKEMFNIIERVAYLPFYKHKEIIGPSVSVRDSVKDVTELMHHPTHTVTPWIMANALRCLKKLNDKSALPTIVESLKSTDIPVLEAAISALTRLEEDKTKQNELLLSVPTSLLVRLSPEILTGR